MNNFQHRDWIHNLSVFSRVGCSHVYNIISITLASVTFVIFFSFIINCSCLDGFLKIKNNLSHIEQNDNFDQRRTSVKEKEKTSIVIVMDHSNGYSTSQKKLPEIKKEETGNGYRQVFNDADLKYFHRKIKTKLPKYEKIIKQEASKYGLDWTLVAAVMYQESHFNPRARSFTGVRGLMQLTLRTARELGVENRLDPVQSIKGGVKYLNKLWRRFEDVHGPDRLHFTLASYNIGYGHVRDAQKLARLKGLNMKKWSSVEQCLPLLTDEEYYRQTKYGYARGREPVHYVKRIIAYYDILRKLHMDNGYG